MFRSNSSNPAVGIGCGIIFGGLFALAALGLLWYNEGRPNMARVAADSALVPIEEVASANDGDFIALQGTIHAQEPLGDTPFLKSGPYLEIEREVEMFAWTEESDKGDDENDIVAYTYTQEWTRSPETSFKGATAHENPPLEHEGKQLRANIANIGAILVNMHELDLPSSKPLPLTGEILRAGDDPRGVERFIDDDYLYIAQGSAEEPEIGDLRIKYEVVESDQAMTVFGTLKGDTIIPYQFEEDRTLYRAFTSGREEALGTMRTEYRVSLWGLRMLGTFLNFIGLMIMIAPVRSLLGRIPLLGRLGNRLIALAGFVLALALSIIVIIVSYVVHTPILLIAIVLILAGIGYYLYQQREQAELNREYSGGVGE